MRCLVGKPSPALIPHVVDTFRGFDSFPLPVLVGTVPNLIPGLVV